MTAPSTSTVFASSDAAAECAVGKDDCSELTVVSPTTTCKFSRTSTTVKLSENPWNFKYTHKLYWSTTAGKTGAAEYKSTVDPDCKISSKVGTLAATACKRFATVTFNSPLGPVEDPATFSGTCSTTVGGLPGTTICCPRTPCPAPQDSEPQNSGEYESGDENFSMAFDSFFSFTNKTITYTVVNNSPTFLDFDWTGLKALGITNFSGTLPPGQLAFMVVPAANSRESPVELQCFFNDPGGTEIAAGVPTQVPAPPIPPVPVFVDVLLGLHDDPNDIVASDINGDGIADGTDIAFYVQAMLRP